ncbi:MAG: GNAT family N-acetyltransferase [Bacteroidales bacterium]
MLLEITKSGKVSGIVGHNVDYITIGDNPCLPEIIAEVFGWEAIQINFTTDSGEAISIGACRKGQKIVLLPQFSYGPSLKQVIAGELIQVLKKNGFVCEWRMTSKISEFTFTDKATTLIQLQSNPNLESQPFSSNLRRKIRKCASNKIKFKTGKSELIADFYGVYSRNMHRLGSPAQPIKWFLALIEKYGNGDAVICCAYLDEKAVGVAFMLEYQGFYEACWVSTLDKYNKLYVSYGLYWEMIRFAIESNGVQFSFGRSTIDSGVHKFKQQWGGLDVQLFWNYSHPQRKNIRKFTFLPKIWKVLPYKVAKHLGPVVSGWFY